MTSHHSIQIGAVHIHLAVEETVCRDLEAKLADTLTESNFEHYDVDGQRS